MNNLKKIRSFVGMTQTSLARQVGVSKTAICNAEKGRISPELATKCASVLKCSPFSILGLDVLVLRPTSSDDIIHIERNLVAMVD